MCRGHNLTYLGAKVRCSVFICDIVVIYWFFTAQCIGGFEQWQNDCSFRRWWFLCAWLSVCFGCRDAEWASRLCQSIWFLCVGCEITLLRLLGPNKRIYPPTAPTQEPALYHPVRIWWTAIVVHMFTNDDGFMLFWSLFYGTGQQCCQSPMKWFTGTDSLSCECKIAFARAACTNCDKDSDNGDMAGILRQHIKW